MELKVGWVDSRRVELTCMDESICSEKQFALLSTLHEGNLELRSLY